MNLQSTRSARPLILVAEDDPDDRLLVEEAHVEGGGRGSLGFVMDGKELMEFLRFERAYADRERVLPSLVLLDLNMPRLDGRLALEQIRAEPKLLHLPVVILTTSSSEDDILGSYARGANSFIVKPASFIGLVEVMGTLDRYWLQVVSLPFDGEAM